MAKLMVFNVLDVKLNDTIPLDDGEMGHSRTLVITDAEGNTTEVLLFSDRAASKTCLDFQTPTNDI